MTTGNEEQAPREPNGNQPNVSPELQDAIRSIDAIGENAWGKDDDEDAPRQSESARSESAQSESSQSESVEADPSLPDSPEGNPDAP